MYIILSWIGWGWLLVAGVAVLLLERHRRHAARPGDFPVAPAIADAEVGSRAESVSGNPRCEPTSVSGGVALATLDRTRPNRVAEATLPLDRPGTNSNREL
jgi:hypothetical protein